MFWFLIGAGAVVVVYYVFIKPFKYWDELGVSQYTVWKTWLETLLGLIQYRCITDAIKKTYDDFSGVRYSGFYQFNSPFLSIRDPDLIKQITVKDFEHFVDHFNFSAATDDPLWKRNLFFLKGEKWREMRTTLSPSFTSNKMKIMFGLMNDCGKQFVDYYLEQKEDVIHAEMKDVFTRFANDVIATTAFGVTCNSIRDRDNEFYLMGKEATNFSNGLKVMFCMIFPRVAKLMGIKMFNNEVGSFFQSVISDNIKAREENEIVRPDMIHLLLEARKGKLRGDKNSELIPKDKLSNEDIAAQAFIFFLAGFDSVATLMYFLAYEIAIQPDIQQRLQDEIDEILGNFSGELSYEALSNMKYMDMVMSETLRKWPSAMVLDRICVKPYTIQPVKNNEKPVYLKEGNLITIPVYGIHRDPEYFPDPDRFDPERFSDANKASINPYAYLPFGTGPRACLGNRFALMETKVIFFHLLAKFDIVVIEKTPIPLVLSKSKFQMDTDKGFWLGFKLRRSSKL